MRTAVFRAPALIVESVCVLGAGTIGLLALQVARAYGAGQDMITTKHAHQADVATSFGAHRIQDACRAAVRKDHDLLKALIVC
jgi:threonine dehydrogenase-like Zn-dependent dehydrogenase